jgi:hypothetical protein
MEIVQPKTLHLVDPWEYESGAMYKQALYGGAVGGNQDHMNSIYNLVNERFRKEIEAGIIFIHRVPSKDACILFPDDYFDWIYIDGNHLYEFVKQDLELFYPKVKKGGFIAGDDYHRGGWWKGGVKKAVDEFISKGSCKTVVLANRQFILRKC